jgi:nitrate/nitrite transporter NarK
MASVSETYWQIMPSQGICIGIGNGLVFTPALTIVSTYFKETQVSALGVTATGNATGGLIFPSMVRKLLP